MDKYYAEELILAMAEIVYENRRLHKENLELLKERKEHRKFVNKLVNTNLNNTVQFLECTINKEEK